LKRKKLSILLPFHIDNQFLNDAIASCVSAMDEDSELILINTSGLKYRRHSNFQIIDAPGRNYIEALSIGLNEAHGEYTALMNSDDLILKNRFQKQISKLNEDQADLVFCGMKKFKGKNRAIFPLLGELKGDQYLSEFLLLGSYGANATWLFRTSWANDLQLFKSSLDSSDWTTALRVFPKSKITYVPDKLYLYRMHPTQITRTLSEHHSTLYSLWTSLNESLNLPHLTFQEVKNLTHPNFIQRQDEITSNIFDWFSGYLDRLPSHDAIDDLLNRRYLILSLGSPIKYRHNFNLGLLIKVLAEFSWNLSKPRY
jgi:glycosyltransferase involved in cell wall biosynthesis